MAQEAAKDFIEPRVSRPQYLLMYRQLGLDSGQRSIAELMFSDYTTTLDDLARRLDEQAVAAGSKTVHDAMMGKSRLAADELRAKRVGVLKVYQQGLPAIDHALDDLLSGLESVLTPDQTMLFEPARRELLRDVYLHPRQTGSDFQEYAGDGVDVLMLYADATKDDGELKGLDSSTCQAILNDYELRLDALLAQSAREYRNAKLSRKIAGIEKDNAAMHDLDQAALARWKDLFQLNQKTVREIGAIAATSLGASAQQKWLDRFDQASFKWLYPRRKPDRQIDWMRRESLPAETMAKADAIYDGYIAKRRELSRQAIDIMLRARIEFQTMLYSMMDPTNIDDRVRRGLYEELLKNTGEQANAETNASGALEGLLTASQRESMRKATQGAEPGRKR